MRRFVLHNGDRILAEGVEFSDRRFALAWRRHTRLTIGMRKFGSGTGGVESWLSALPPPYRSALRWLDPRPTESE